MCPIVPQHHPPPAGWQCEWAAAIFRVKLLGPPQKSDCIFRRVGGREGDRGAKLFSEHMSLLATEQDCGHNERETIAVARGRACYVSGGMFATAQETRPRPTAAQITAKPHGGREEAGDSQHQDEVPRSHASRLEADFQ